MEKIVLPLCRSQPERKLMITVWFIQNGLMLSQLERGI